MRKILIALCLILVGCQTTYKNQENFLINTSTDPIEEISYFFPTGEEVVLSVKMEDGSFQSTTYQKYILEVVTRTKKRIRGFAVSLEDFSRENVFDPKTLPESLTLAIIRIKKEDGDIQEILEIVRNRQ
jgi:hypothetical protein